MRTFCDLMPSISMASMIMSLAFCNGGGQPASQISPKDFISAFTSLRNGKSMWYVQFMVIRHKREEVKQAGEREVGVKKYLGTSTLKHIKILPIGEEVVSLSRALKQTTSQLRVSMGISLCEITNAVS